MSRLISADAVCRFMAMMFLVMLLIGCTLPRPGNNLDVSPAVAQTGETPVLPPVEAQGEGETVIRLQPPAQQLNVGDMATVEIYVENVTNLSAAEVHLQFTSGLLEAQDADPGKEGVQLQPGNFLAPDFIVTNNVDNAAGVAYYALTQVAPTQPVSGSGVLASVSFRAIAQGDSPLTLVLTKLATGNGQPIPVTAQAGQIRVGQPTGEVTATFTVTPTTPVPTTPVAGEPTATFTVTPESPTATPELPTTTPPAPPTDTPTPLPPPPATNTPVPPVVNIPPGATVGFCYRVQPEDTLYSIGQKFGVNYLDISLVNGLWSPDVIFTHQGLFIPQQMGYGPNVYVTQPGDTLNGIAEACNLPLAYLADVNNLGTDVTLEAGHVLVIPIPPGPPPRSAPPPPVFQPPYYVPPPPPPPCYWPAGCW